MASIVREYRFDFRGGCVRSFNPDILDRTELRLLRNLRVYYGQIEVRPGTQRIHTVPLAAGAPILGAVQWNSQTVTQQLVAIAGGHLYHKAPADADFTEVTSTLSTTRRPWFVPWASSTAPALYFAEGALRKWTGTSLVTSINGAPAARTLAIYRERLFATDGTEKLYWSKINDPETWAAPDGGFAIVSTYDYDPLVGLATVGSSLLLFKEGSIARFTGVSNTNIQIDKETTGISAEVGCVAPKTIVRFGRNVFFLSDRGPYIADETAVVFIGQKIESEIENWDHNNLHNAVAVVNRRRREILLMVPAAGSTQNNTGWVWSWELGAWSGAQEYSEEWASAAPYERSDQTESVIYGGYDGFVREADVTSYGALDDVLRNGTGGVPISWRLELPILPFGDPSRFKLGHLTQSVQADLGSAPSAVTVEFNSETMPAPRTQTINTKGAGAREYNLRPGWRGRRLELAIERANGTRFVKLYGLVLSILFGRRVA